MDNQMIVENVTISDDIVIESLNLEPGFVLESGENKYIITNVLGHGTFGITYVASIASGRKKGKKVAIKEFYMRGFNSRDNSGSVTASSDTTISDYYREEFILEAKNLIELNHPNIVKAFDIFETNGTTYYAMDYIDGENLNDYIKHKTLSLDEATKIITKVAYALSYMHESQHMLHLDLKPGNIMRRASDGQIILIDFGLSRFFTEEGNPETETKIGLGTAGYAPLEQMKRNKLQEKEFKATIDVYSLGATFYKLITGQSPAKADFLAANPDCIHESLRSRNIPEHIVNIVSKAMSMVPQNRYQSVMSMIYDLDAEERKRRNKTLLYSIIGIASVILSIWGIIHVNNAKSIELQAQDDRKKQYFEELDHYAFKLQSAMNGANHYGECGYYKFFSNGTGFYLFESWHDISDCDDPSCDLDARVDTLSFKYKVKGNAIIFDCNYTFSSPETIYVNIDNRKFDLEQSSVTYLYEDDINWDEVKRILNR